MIGPGEETRTQAWYWIESHPLHISFRLPDQASWVLCRIDGRPVTPLRADASGSSYRLNLASESPSSPVLVELEYKQSGAQARRVCSPPDLLEGAVVLQTLWEVRIPWNLGLIGTPREWVDENEWYWDVYIWKRRPWASAARLLGWVQGAEAHAGGLAIGDEQDDSHSYLFGRGGGPVPLDVWILPRRHRRLLLGVRAPFQFLLDVFPCPVRGHLGGDGGPLPAGRDSCPPQRPRAFSSISVYRRRAGFAWGSDPARARAGQVARRSGVQVRDRRRTGWIVASAWGRGRRGL